MDWSKEALRREMSQQQAPLISRRKDEPSFTLSKNATFVIEGSMEYIDSPYGPQSDLQSYPTPYIYKEFWYVYRKNEDDPYQVNFGSGGFIFPTDVISFVYLRAPYKNPRDYKSKIYVSFFRTDSDECVALVTLIETGTGEVYLSNGSQSPQTYKTARAKMMYLMDSVPGIKDIPTNDEINPLHAWQEKSRIEGTSYYADVNRNLPWESAQIACPPDPEFDESRISKIPGYIETRTYDFSRYPRISRVPQYQKITLEF